MLAPWGETNSSPDVGENLMPFNIAILGKLDVAIGSLNQQEQQIVTLQGIDGTHVATTRLCFREVPIIRLPGTASSRCRA